jgi:c(7)-type cytochrome triheme protein
MSMRRFSIVCLSVLAVPSLLFALGMEAVAGMGGMPGMVDEVVIQTEAVGKVVFSHGRHGTRCNACHPKLFEKKRSNKRVTMKAMEGGKSCGACHNGQAAFSVKRNCTRCHVVGDILYKIEDPGDATFSHSFHMDAVGGCDACHPKVFKARRGANTATMEDMEKGRSCGACHDGSGAFNVTGECEKCHKM